MSNNNHLHSDFIIELAKTCLTNPKILSICQKELKYSFLANEAEKNVFKFLYDTFEVTSTIPTVGVIGQNFSTSSETIAFLAKVKNVKKIENDSIVLEQLEDHIKKIRFSTLLAESVDLFNKGKKEEAFLLVKSESEEIVNFSFKDSYYTAVFKDFDKRIEERQRKAALNDQSNERIEFGIHELDEHSGGGIKKGSSALVMAKSGGGKSTFLRWVGTHNARLGKRVVHFQAEGSEQDCYDLYDSTWTGVMTEQMSIGSLSDNQQRQIEKTRRDILVRGGEIYVYASETFDSMSLEDAREILLDIQTTYGEIDLIIFDYLEIFNVAGRFSGEAGERRRRESVANKMTNLAVEFNAATLTATQANDIAPKDYNNPDFMLTRHHISEFKGAVKPFSYFITVNQTDEQAAAGIAMLYEDKFRYSKSGRKVVIYQSLNQGRFYNSKKTINEILN